MSPESNGERCDKNKDKELQHEHVECLKLGKHFGEEVPKEANIRQQVAHHQLKAENFVDPLKRALRQPTEAENSNHSQNTRNHNSPTTHWLKS